MMMLNEIISNIRKNEYINVGDKSYFTDGGILDIKALLMCDRLFRSIDESSYDAIILGDGFGDVDGINTLEAGTKMFGDIMSDKQKRFKDGHFIITSRIESVEHIFSEFALAKTKNTTYLVIH